MAQKIRIIGVPMDLGQSRRGVDMGPSAVRVAGLLTKLKQLGHQVEDLGNISVKQPEEMHFGEKRAKYLDEIAETCKDLGEQTGKALADGFLPLVLGGDHSIAAGSCSGVSNFFHKESKKIGCIWLDAHGDMNTPESSPSGNVHGMPLAAIIGHGPAGADGPLRLSAEGRAAQRIARGSARPRREGATPHQGDGRACVHDARYRRARLARCDE